jgi:AraC family transcriptional regulator, positive regulator of tynA and feaB
VADTWTLRQWPAAERAEAWRDVVSRTHLPWSLDADRDADPRAAATVVDRVVDGLRLVDCTAPACAGRRGRREIAGTAGEYVGVLTVLAGHEHIEQDDQRVVLTAGRTLVWSSARPVRFVVPGALRKRTLLVPRARLAAGAGERLAVLDGPANRLLVDHLAAVSAVGDLTGPAAAAAATAALELLSAALPQPVADPDRVRWERVRDHIEEHLADRALRPQSIAAAHAVSVRALYQLFERRGETVSGYVRRRRLARARADLARSGPATTVAEIAHRWGFADQAAFSRAFRRQYGCPPTALRGRAWEAGP